MHIGLIPDGNRRFMKKQGILKLSESYNLGITRFHDFLEWCGEKGVDDVTIYALSTENIENRSREEISTLLKVFNENAVKAITDERIRKNEIRISLCGDLDAIRNSCENAGEMLENLEKLVAETSGYEKLNLNLAIGYGGRQEIINACKRIVSEGGEINEENIKRNLWVTGYPDIIIRTSETRLSNFLTWQSAYSEIHFIDCLWQEFTENHLDEILESFRKGERRFGR